ncbi:MAG: PilZ domain-containing protein [Treponema sp.]|jgi:hypothetical protein|nr:PilZ domain-containing protein [Treponema sp.]
MALVTSQKIAAYYERFKSIDVTFTKEIIQVTGLITQQVHLKCVGDFWPCVIYSTSFQGARVVVNTRSALIQKLQQANNMVSLRFCFKNSESDTPLTFFTAARSTGYSPYGGSKETAIFTLQFTQRPPDDLIEIIGRVLDANINSTKRKDERILLTVESLRRLKLLAKETAAFIQSVPRRCILRDLSFSGCKLIMMGVEKFLVNREAALRIDFDDPRESFLVRGSFIRTEEVEGRKELIALAMQFDTTLIPMGYKMRINDYLNQFSFTIKEAGSKPAEAPVTAKIPATTQGAAAPGTPQEAGASAAPQGAETPGPAGSG